MQRFQCPTCAAPLPDPPNTPTMPCPYCGATVIVPSELRPAEIAPAPVAAHSPGAASAAGAGVLLDDDFSNRENGWEPDDGEGQQGYVDRGYRMRLDDDEWEAWAYRDDAEGDDLSVEVEITKTSGPADAWFGLAMRTNDDGGYYFCCYADGRYGIYGYEEEEDDEGYTLVEAAEQGIVNTGNATNRIRAICKGKRLELHVNGKLALETKNDDYDEGYFELVVGREETERGVIEVVFRKLVARTA